VIDDELAVDPLKDLGWTVETLSWKSDSDWDRFDVVAVRTAWDYHYQPEQFLACLDEIDKSKAVLENSFAAIKWNLEKTYLEDLARSGVRIVPTVFCAQIVDQNLIDIWQDHFEAERLVIKPIISATATNTFLVNSCEDELSVFDSIPYMVQPYMHRIADEGEFSLFYFDGTFSHAISKIPKSHDFRVQEEFGGTNSLISADPNSLDFAQLVIDVLPEKPLYARVDIILDDDDCYSLMELELIEPALYFRYDENAACRFAEALNKRFNEL
jgi:glutathione synthase/RimK-type ligase-like ATP-grasp enzyme